jgi:hypothetical protein
MRSVCASPKGIAPDMSDRFVGQHTVVQDESQVFDVHASGSLSWQFFEPTFTSCNSF